MEVTIKEGDPNWIGAWWLGFPVIGTCIFLFAGKFVRLRDSWMQVSVILFIFLAPLLLFPERLPKDYTDASKRKKEEESKNMLEPIKSRSQWFTSLMAELRQDIKRVSSFSRCLNEIFPWRNCSVTLTQMRRLTNTNLLFEVNLPEHP